MKKSVIHLLLAFISFPVLSQKIETPDVIYGELFKDIQTSRIFPDSKTFVDGVPKKDPKEIVKEYLAIKNNPAIRFSLKMFVEENFILPSSPQPNYITKENDVVMHIKNLWGVLKREADKPVEGSSLLPLPYPYMVPGGRFREIYYWDSYFTMLGLKESGEYEMMENMVKNFAYLVETFGHIPNGNRSYYLSRSQPPFFSLMVELLASVKGDHVYATFLPALEKEYQYWMEGAEVLKPGQALKRVVKLKDGSIMNRYWDENPAPRQESYVEDVETAEKSKRSKTEMYQNLRAGAASGWDFSSRWFSDQKNLTSIEVAQMVPVDLNCLLYNLETVLSVCKLRTGNETQAGEYRKKADERRAAIDKYCWNTTLKFYCDYNFKTAAISNLVTPAGMFPFCFFQRRTDYMSLLARQAAEQVKAKLLKPGGILTTTNETGQQWDAPNGWAPLQWMTIWGFERCGQKGFAADIAYRWTKLNIDVFKRTGKLMEKYNVVNTGLEAGGGEYPGQDGFGWTNGVLLALIKKYGMPK